jgi:regulator of replication initiation timing
LVRDEVENLKDDIEETIRNLHMDMISQFHQQSQELKNTLSMQMATIDRLTEENEILREDNDRLKGENQSASDMS